MRLSHQLFFTLLTASALLVALMFAISSWSFSRGFLQYVNNAEQARLQPLIENLASAYELEPNWDWVKKDSEQWRYLLETSIIGSILGPQRPPPLHLAPRQESPSGKSPSRNSGPEKRGRKNRDERSSPPKQGASGGGRRDRAIVPRLLFKDSKHQILIGREANATQIRWLPVEVNDEAVGYVGYRAQTELQESYDQLFEKQQRRGYGIAALAMILLSGLLSIPLAARIVKPILKLNHTVNDISHGEYERRVDIARNDEIGDLARNVNKLGFTLERNLAARQRWIAEISHELRTPVAVLQGEVEALQDGIRPFDEQAAQSIHSEILRLSRLINDLHQLSLSDVGALDYKMAPISVSDVIDQLFNSNVAALSDAKLDWHVQHNKNGMPVSANEVFIIQADEQRITQLFGNLLQNSIRYTQMEGKLRVVINKTPSMVEINWSDSSPGVSEAELPQLLDPLYRTDQSRSRQNGGAGLGLSIVKNIVDAHGGTISLAQASLGGLSITISIPVQEALT